MQLSVAARCQTRIVRHHKKRLFPIACGRHNDIKGVPGNDADVAAERDALKADRDGLALVTTEKDLVRLQGEDPLSELFGRTRALPVALTLDDEAAFRTFLLGRLSTARRT